MNGFGCLLQLYIARGISSQCCRKPATGCDCDEIFWEPSTHPVAAVYIVGLRDDVVGIRTR